MDEAAAAAAATDTDTAAPAEETLCDPAELSKLIAYIKNGTADDNNFDPNHATNSAIQLRKNGLLSRTVIDNLQNVGFDRWDTLDATWEKTYKAILEHYNQAGNNGTSDSPSHKLWIQQQQNHHAQQALSHDRVDALERLPKWSWVSDCYQHTVSNHNQDNQFLVFPSTVF